MPSKKKFKCIQCGECCRKLAIPIAYSDIKKWQGAQRWDILRKVGFSRKAPTGQGFYIGDTLTIKPCPFLKDNLCSIHDIKPVCCKNAPYGPDKYDCCPVWDESYINQNRLKKVRRRQMKDLKRTVENCDEIMGILNVAYYGN